MVGRSLPKRHTVLSGFGTDRLPRSRNVQSVGLPLSPFLLRVFQRLFVFSPTGPHQYRHLIAVSHRTTGVDPKRAGEKVYGVPWQTMFPRSQPW